MGKNMQGLLQEYLEIKAQNRDAVLFWREGDFYTTYFDDAMITAKTLGCRSITTKEGVLMTGAPWHSISSSLAKMVKAGHRVAVCEPSALPTGCGRGTDYEVVRVVSPGLDRRGIEEEVTFDRMGRKLAEANRKLDQLARLLAERDGQKWRPQLRVIQGGGNSTPITRKVTRHRNP